MVQIALYEDSLAGNFSPIALLRPVFELRCGQFTSRERFEHVSRAALWGAAVRPVLADVYREEHPGLKVNDFSGPREQPVAFINGRWIGDAEELLKPLMEGTAVYVEDELAAVAIPKEASLPEDPAELPDRLQQLARNAKKIDGSGTFLKHPWDLVHENPSQLKIDFESRDRYSGPPRLDQRVALLGELTEIHIDPSADIDPFVVLDARTGPIWIDEGVRVQAFTRLEGPCFIGRETQIFRANIRAGCSIGPVCRVGGEIEETIFHGFGNKYHDGFVGHSYVCPWVNLGALTTNSDLKNDYSSVKVPIDGIPIETSEAKIGCYLGDHTKTALCSLFNTGSAIGIMSLILPGGELLPKHIPSFTRLWHGRIEELPDGVDSSLDCARTAMNRRGQHLTSAGEALLHATFELTRQERQRALARQDAPFHHPRR